MWRKYKGYRDGGGEYRERRLDWGTFLGTSCENLVQWKLPGIYESDNRKKLLVTGDMKVVAIGHQHNHKTFERKSVLPTGYVLVMVAQNLWEWST